MRPLLFPLAALLVASLGWAAPGCLDITPVPQRPLDEDGGDDGGDAAAEGGDGGGGDAADGGPEACPDASGCAL